jgi:hypothetical protein
MRVLSSRSGVPSLLSAAASFATAGHPPASLQTEHFKISTIYTLGAEGAAISANVAARCESDYAKISSWFSITPPKQNPSTFTVIIAPLSTYADGTGGAFHHTCEASDIYCDVKLAPAPDYNFTNALLVAEEVEVFSAAQGRGWNCGASNGEGLSRVLAEALYPGTLDDFSVASSWLDSERSDWVNATNYTDVDPITNGCAVLFLNWMHERQKHEWGTICQAGGDTLAETYRRVTDTTINPFDIFRHDIDEMFPIGQASNLTTDNPFAAKK